MSQLLSHVTTCYTSHITRHNMSHITRHNMSHVPISRSLSEGRFDGQFVSYLKQSSREVSPQEEEEEEERVVLSPTSLLLSPSSTPWT